MGRRCKTCGVSIDHKKKNAKYCSPICKTNYWLYGENYNKVKNAKDGEIRKSDYLVSRKKHEPKRKVVEPLKGVIEDKPENESNVPKQITNPKYSKLRDIMSNLELLLKQEKIKLNEVNVYLNQLSSQNPVLMSGGTGTVLGGFAHAISSNQKKAEFSFGGALIGGLLGAGLGFVLKRNAQNEIETINERTIPSIKKRIGYLTIQLKQANSFLLKIPQLIANPDYKDPINKKPISTPLPEADIIQNDVGQEELSTKGKIICSNDLKGMKFRSLDFKDDWQSLLGKPSVDFKMAVFGKPGQGKSTFCLQFANYLAQNFGRVLYVSGEEGFSKTMKDKLQDNRAFDKNLFIADICSAEDMIENIPQNAYHFIIVDSLNNMGIDENSLLELEEHYNNCAMISIAQSTKKGEMRGSQEILHNVDIVLKVEDGFAECTKNRFAPLGFEFSIF